MRSAVRIYGIFYFDCKTLRRSSVEACFVDLGCRDCSVSIIHSKDDDTEVPLWLKAVEECTIRSSCVPKTSVPTVRASS